MDLGCQNEAKLAPKWDQKSMFTWNGDFSKIVLWLQRGLDFHNLRIQVGNKYRSNINQKTELKMECTLASIVIRFWSVSACSLDGKTIKKKDVESIKNCIVFVKRPAPAKKERSLPTP